MSLVGPRPHLLSYYDKLEAENVKILELKPRITSFASIIYNNEKYLLAKKDYLLQYNDDVIFPHTMRMNLDGYYNRSILEI